MQDIRDNLLRLKFQNTNRFVICVPNVTSNTPTSVTPLNMCENTIQTHCSMIQIHWQLTSAIRSYRQAEDTEKHNKAALLTNVTHKLMYTYYTITHAPMQCIYTLQLHKSLQHIYFNAVITLIKIIHISL